MAYIYDLADTWNSGTTTFTGIKLNVTDSASTVGSLLMDLQVGGVSKFNVRKDGSITAGNGVSNNMVFTPVANSLVVGVAGIITGGIRHITGSSITLLSGSAYSTTHATDAMLNGALGLVGWHSSTYSFQNLTPDLALYRDAAGTLAQRNGANNPQTFNIYKTYTDALNYERLAIKWNANVLEIGTEVGTTGTIRQIKVGPDWRTGVGLSGGNATGGYAVACGASSATNNYTFAAGGGTASGANAIAIGRDVGASGTTSIAMGNLTQAYQANQFALGFAFFGEGNAGVCQTSTFVLNLITTNATPTEMSTSYLSMTRMVVRASTTWAFEITVAARSDGGIDNAMYMYRGMIKRDAANNTVLVGTVDNIYTNETNAAWNVVITADDVNESLKIEVTGAAATNINWTAKVILTEVGNI